MKHLLLFHERSLEDTTGLSEERLRFGSSFDGAGFERLCKLLNQGQVLAHTFVIGELALGNLQNRAAILDALQDLPQAPVATEEEVLSFIQQKALYGMGIGYIDAHLLAAVRLAPGATLWTRDKRLLAAGTSLGLVENGGH